MPEKKANSAAPKLIKLSQNPFFVFDFVEYGDRLLGVGVGLRNEGRYLFEFNKRAKQWEPLPIWLETRRHSNREENFESFSGIFRQGADVWLTSHMGSIIRGNPDSADWGVSAILPDNIDHIYFVNSNIGYATGELSAGGELSTGCRVFKTTDGGKHWAKIYENELSGNPFDLYVFDEKTILVAMNDEYILRSEDGGKTWKQTGPENPSHPTNDTAWVKRNVSGASAITAYNNIAWVVGEKGSFYYSEDAGKSWSRPAFVTEVAGNQKLNSIDFSKDGKGLAVGDDGLILFTIDGGKRWYEVPVSSVSDTLNDKSNNKTDDLVKVKFVGPTALVLGRAGTYEITF
ncbi:MAG: WD40/YVTN/BNR-like repeat-containing protein [Pyrinomonadaceae bacterium]